MADSPSSRKLNSSRTSLKQVRKNSVNLEKTRTTTKLPESQNPQRAKLDLGNGSDLAVDNTEGSSTVKVKRGAAVQAMKNLERNGKGKKRELEAENHSSSTSARSRSARKHHHNVKNPSSANGSEHPTCPICNLRLVSADSDYVNAHIDRCLENGGGASETRADGFDEYTWMGETRIRAVSLLEGGLSGAGFSPTKNYNDIEEDLNVDEDDEQVYGASQYSERDIIRLNDGEVELRNMVANYANEQQESSKSEESSWKIPLEVDSDTNVKAELPELPHDPKLIIASLKTRIKQLEAEAQSMSRCLICLESYKRPLTSIVCWHVHCEKCWLQSLGAKKLCPQCQKITLAGDLRRVYL